MDDWKGIAVIFEQEDGEIHEISWELLGKARELGDKAGQEVLAFVLGTAVEPLAQEIIARGADKVIVAEHELLDYYRCETFTKVCTAIIESYKPSMLLVGATPNGRELAGRLAVKLQTGLTADVVQLDVKDGLLLGAVPGFGGSILAIIKCEHARPQMATVRPGIFTKLEENPDRKGVVEKFKVELSEKDVSTKIIQRYKLDLEDISKAKRLVAAGRGIGNNFELVQKIADLLKASVGLTRPLCDLGILPRNHQVGSTGVTVKADQVLVLGASGAMHFTSGIQDSGEIIAVNTDETAPIFEYADYIVIEDLDALLPALLEELEKRVAVETR